MSPGPPSADISSAPPHCVVKTSHRRRRVIFIEPAPENRRQYVGDAQAYVIYVEYKRFCSVKVP